MMGLGCGCGGSQGLQGLGATQRDRTPDIVGGVAAVAVPWAYVKYRKKKWPKANLWGQLAMVGVTYFGVRFAFTKLG